MKLKHFTSSFPNVILTLVFYYYLYQNLMNYIINVKTKSAMYLLMKQILGHIKICHTFVYLL